MLSGAIAIESERILNDRIVAGPNDKIVFADQWFADQGLWQSPEKPYS